MAVFPEALERSWDKSAVDKAVLEYLEACGIKSDVLAQTRRELLGLAPPSNTDCKLARLFKYALDGRMDITVSKLSGETEQFEVYQWTTVRDLKELIEDRLGIPIPEQQILKCGRQLKIDSECLAGNRVTFCEAHLELLRVEVQEPKEDLEVMLTTSTNIPEGSIVSIRAGNSRRQAPLSYDHPFKFPLKKDEANPFKINIFSQFGKARLVLRSSEEKYVAQIEDDNGKHIGIIELEVRDSSSRERSRRSTVESQPSTVSLKAKKSVVVSHYLEEHGFVEYLQSLIQSVMHERPPDPYRYMIRQLQAAAAARGNETNISVERGTQTGEIDDSAEFQQPGCSDRENVTD